MEHFIWSDKEDQKQLYSQRKIMPLNVPTLKKEIQQIYLHKNCAIFLSLGNIYKQGYLPWEKVGDNKYNITHYPIQIHNNDINPIVTYLSFGEKHILILTLAGCVYTWGDNYYGQLGISNFMLPELNEPQYLKHNEKFRTIFAYKYNSFGIDVEDKLWVWGKSEFIGSNFKGHKFKPVKILSQYKVDRLTMNDDRIIVRVSNEFSNSDLNILNIPPVK
jgi:alpha-tubulin suppressor-like RCC1 family protein